MAQDREYPSYLTCVAEVLSNSPTPLSIETLVSRIAKERPVGSGARSAVYQAIGKLYQAIPVGTGRFGWLSSVCCGVSISDIPLRVEKFGRERCCWTSWNTLFSSLNSFRRTGLTCG